MKKNLLFFAFLLSIAFVNAQEVKLKDNNQPFDTLSFSPTHSPNGVLGFGEECSHNLTTTYTSNNGHDGVMFEIAVLQDVNIAGFSTNINGTGYIKIYGKYGSYIGSETVPGDWTFLDSVMVTSEGPDTPTFIPIHSGPYLPAGSTCSYYITGTGTGADLNYTDGTLEGSIYASNSDIAVKEGKGVGYPFGSNFSPRVFNGTVHYCKIVPVNCDTIVTQFNAINGNAGIAFDITAPLNQITITTMALDYANGYTEGDVFVYTRPGTHVGFDTSPVGWTLVDSAHITFPMGR